MNIKEFEKNPVLGILRGVSEASLEGTFQSAIDAGFSAIEITMNTSGASELIAQAVKKFSDKISIGAGTVNDTSLLDQALSAGASFIVTPVFNEKIGQICTNNSIPFFPGALTPMEIYRAWESGASMIKVFPAGVFGPSYFSSIKGPFENIKLMAVGGVTLQNISEYFKNGASAIATGSSVFNKEWMEQKDFKAIFNAGKEYIEEVRKCLE